MSERIAKFKHQIEESLLVKSKVLEDGNFLIALDMVVGAILNALSLGGKVYFAGNGGSAADAQHLAAEFVSRLNFDRAALPAQSLSTDTSVLTSIGNDYGFELLFARQLQAQAKRADVFVGITTSGRSKNILAAFNECRNLGVTSVALCGLGGELDGAVDHLLRIPSFDTARTQETHILVGHLICSAVESEWFSGKSLV